MTWRVAVALEIETDDPRLSPTRMNREGNESAADTAITRQAVLDNLHRTARVVMVTGPELLRTVLDTHELAQQILRDHGLAMPEMFSRPPRSYQSPDDVWRRQQRRKKH